MKLFLAILIILHGTLCFAQTEEEAYFKHRLEEARQGDAGAQDDVGTLYAEGRGVKKDYRKAVYWLKRSAAQGDVLGACNLAIEYGRGRGISKNVVLAMKWVFVSHSLDHLKCFPSDFVKELKPSKAQLKKSRDLGITFLRAHPELKDEFGDRPWFNSDFVTQPNKRLERTRR